MPRRKHSQVFLKDVNYVRKIAERADVSEREWILEIGPGRGNLTSELLKAGARVLAIEIDSDLNRFLSDQFSLFLNDRLFLINDDFLEINLADIFARYGISELKTVSNIPYHITTPILEKLIYNRNFFPEIYITVQKEVAERVVAPPGRKAYGSLSVFVNLFYDSFLEFNIPRSCFYPVPEVDSSLLRLKRKDVVEDLRDFERFVRRLFRGRRKKIRTLLKSMGYYSPSFESKFHDFLDKRPESLSISDFKDIFRECQAIKNEIQ